MEPLRDPIWQFVGALLAGVAIIVSMIVFFLQRWKKSLGYEIVSETVLLTVEEELKGNFQILFEGKPVQKIHLLVIKISNNGNLPIASSDFDEPLTFFFGEGTTILSAEIIDTDPKTLRPTYHVDSNCLVFHPTLLNSRDAFVTKLLLVQYRGNIETYSRIIGVREVGRSVEPRTSSIIFLVGIFLIMIAQLPFVLKVVPEGTLSGIGVLLFTGLYLLGLVMVIYEEFRQLRRMKYRRYLKKASRK